MSNILNKLPVWNKALARKLEPVEPVINIGLVAVVLVSIWALLQWKPHYKALWLAYLISP